MKCLTLTYIKDDLKKYYKAIDEVLEETKLAWRRGEDETEYMLGMISGIMIAASNDVNLVGTDFSELCEKEAEARNLILLAREENEIRG